MTWFPLKPVNAVADAFPAAVCETSQCSGWMIRLRQFVKPMQWLDDLPAALPVKLVASLVQLSASCTKSLPA